MQIRSKLTIYFIGITAFMLMVSSILIYYFSYIERVDYFYKRLNNKSITTASLFLKVSEVDSKLINLIKPDKNELLGFETITIYNNSNDEIYKYTDKNYTKLKNNDLTKILTKTKQQKHFKKKIGDLDVISNLIKYKGKKIIVIASAKDKYGIIFLQHLKQNLIYIYLCILSFLGITGWIFAKNALKPISKIMNEVDSLSSSNLSSRLKEDYTNNDEISRLTKTFNQMLDRVEKTFKIQRAFVSNVSHELMNPLSSITSQIEVSLLKDRKPESYILTLESILSDLKKLNIISKQLIDLSNYNETQDRKGFKKIRLDELIWDTRNDYLKMYPECNVEFTMVNLPDDDEQLYIFGNEMLLSTCFKNLIDNGCKFSTNNSVKIDLTIKKQHLIVTFKNDGVGILQKDIKNLFVPFFRSSHNSTIKGYGIGLSIVKSIIELHRVDIEVSSEQNVQTIFKIIF